MKFLATAFAAALSLSLATPAFAAVERYTFDPSHTDIVWFTNHLGFSDSSGTFEGATGSVTLDRDTPANSTVEITIPTSGLTTGQPDFDKHLKSADFLNVEKFPVATFKSTYVKLTGDKTAQVTGTLTLLGKAKPLTLDVKLNTIAANPRSGKQTAGFSATTMLKRSDYGMNYGLPGVGDDVRFVIEAEAVME